MAAQIMLRWRRMCRSALGWLAQGITPQKLALTLALGFAIGCLPMIVVPTLLCTALAFALKLKLPAIQTANYAALPFQIVLAAPFAKLGGRLMRAAPWHGMAVGPVAQMATRAADIAGGALLVWFFLAVPAVVLITVVLTPMLRRIHFKAAEAPAAGD